jgi:hypothetical protein
MNRSSKCPPQQDRSVRQEQHPETKSPGSEADGRDALALPAAPATGLGRAGTCAEESRLPAKAHPQRRPVTMPARSTSTFSRVGVEICRIGTPGLDHADLAGTRCPAGSFRKLRRIWSPHYRPGLTSRASLFGRASGRLGEAPGRGDGQ